MTRDNYRDLNWFGTPPDYLSAEEESMLPDELQDEVTDFNPYHEPAGSPEGGRFASSGSEYGSAGAVAAAQKRAHAAAAATTRLIAAREALRVAGFEASVEGGVHRPNEGPILNAGSYPEHAATIREYWQASSALHQLMSGEHQIKVREPEPLSASVSQSYAETGPMLPREPERAGSATSVTRQPWVPRGSELSPSEPAPVEPRPEGKKTKFKREDFEKDHVALGSFVRNKETEEKFLEEWDKRVGEAPAEFKKHFLGGMDGLVVKLKNGETHTLHTSMQIDYRGGDRLVISGTIYNEKDHNVGTYERSIDLEQLKAESAYFRLQDDYTGSDAGKHMLAGNVEFYAKLGVPKLDVHANITVGGYSWAKYGYVPNPGSWNDLSKRLERQLTGESRTTRTGVHMPESWDEMSFKDQSNIEERWLRDTRQEFLQSEQENWRDSGDALDTAKTDLADEYKPSAEWARDAMDDWRDTRDDDAPRMPFSNDQILASISVKHESGYEGRRDPDIKFVDKKLDKEIPEGVDPAQKTLPGIEPVQYHTMLTQPMRDEIETHLIKAFNTKAEWIADHLEPPDYLKDNVEDYQNEYWSGMTNRERFRWAQNNDALPEIETEEEDEPEPPKAGDTEKEALLKLTRSSNPKAIWAISDSKRGKQLLLGTEWFGKLDLKDKESMDRFRAYVSKAK